MPKPIYEPTSPNSLKWTGEQSGDSLLSFQKCQSSNHPALFTFLQTDNLSYDNLTYLMATLIQIS